MKKIYVSLILSAGIVSTLLSDSNLKDEMRKLEESYEELRNQQKCTLKGLAGNQSMSICFLVHQLAHAISNPECAYNALLLYGPPGTGKTTIANNLALMAGAESMKYSAASMVTNYQGSGSKAIREMFEDVDKTLATGKKVVLFVDEIDAFTKDRDRDVNEDRANALLEFMQEVVKRNGNPCLIIVVATNKKDLLDQAFLSRFELVEVSLPDQSGCQQILEYHLKKYKYNPELNIQQFASRMYHNSMSGRDIEKIIKKAWQKSIMSGAKVMLIGAMNDATQEMIDQKKQILELERKKEYEKKRHEEREELEFEALKEAKEERFRKRMYRHEEDQPKKNEDNSDPIEQFATVAEGVKNLRDIFR